jgi:hypothetical protein
MPIATIHIVYIGCLDKILILYYCQIEARFVGKILGLHFPKLSLSVLSVLSSKSQKILSVYLDKKFFTDNDKPTMDR